MIALKLSGVNVIKHISDFIVLNNTGENIMNGSKSLNKEKIQKFALRKLSIGVVSVSLGICIMSKNDRVLADNSTNNVLNTLPAINSRSSSVNDMAMSASAENSSANNTAMSASAENSSANNTAMPAAAENSSANNTAMPAASAENSKLIAATIRGEITGVAGSTSVTNQQLNIETTINENAKSGDYIDYVFSNVASTGLNNLKITTSDGVTIGKISVLSEAIPEISKQTSGNLEVQESTDPAIAWKANIRVTFTEDINSLPAGTKFNFSTTNISMPVVWADKDYELMASISLKDGNGLISNKYLVKRSIPSETSSGIQLVGNIVMRQDNYTSNSNLIVTPDEEVAEGGTIQFRLTGEDTVIFNPTNLIGRRISETITRKLEKDYTVNQYHAWMIPEKNAPSVLEIVDASNKELTLKVISGTIAANHSATFSLGSDIISLTTNVFKQGAANSKYLQPSSEQLINGKKVKGSNIYTIQGVNSVSDVTYTMYIDKKGNEIIPSTLGHSPKVNIDGWTFDLNYVDDRGFMINVYYKKDSRVEVKDATQTIHYVGAGDQTPTDKIQTQRNALTRTVTIDKVTGEVISMSDWKGTKTFDMFDTPVIDGYHADKKTAGGLTATPDNPDVEETVTYAPNGKIVPVDPNGNPIPGADTPIYQNDPNDPTKVVPNEPIPDVPGYTPVDPIPITPADPGKDTPVPYKQNQYGLTEKFVDEDGNELLPSVDKGSSYKSGDGFDVTGDAKVINGYVLVKQDNTKGTFGNGDETATFIYKKIGKIIPVDENGTPIPGADTPIYQNDPNDPTKVVPNEPIPEVPGYTPVDPSPITPADPTVDTPVPYTKKETPTTPDTPSTPTTPTTPSTPTTSSEPAQPQTPASPAGQGQATPTSAKTEAAKAATLPQTGNGKNEATAAMGLGFAGIASMLALFGTRKKRRED